MTLTEVSGMGPPKPAVEGVVPGLAANATTLLAPAGPGSPGRPVSPGAPWGPVGPCGPASPRKPARVLGVSLPLEMVESLILEPMIVSSARFFEVNVSSLMSLPVTTPSLIWLDLEIT